MKIIDLLNKIANGEEVPKYIQYYNMLKEKLDIMMVCKENIFYKLDQLEIQLNSRIEIIEEDKKIEKLEPIDLEPLESIEKQQDYEISTMWNKINEIIDKLNKEE